MKKLEITVFTKDINYANDLARGLCNECTGLVVFVTKDPETANQSFAEGVLLTDCMDFPRENQIDKLKPVRDILQQAIELNYAKTGKLFEIGVTQTRVIGFYALCGGVGTTSIAITYARLLSMKSEKRVLFLNLGIADDYVKLAESSEAEFGASEDYKGVRFEKLSSKKQFVFMCDKGLPIDYDKFFYKDRWGVRYFKPEDCKNSFVGGLKEKDILDLLKRQKCFDCIVVDLGKMPGDFAGEEFVQAFDELYKVERGGLASVELDDSSCVSESVGKWIDIPADNESFDHQDEYIDISLTGKFAAIVEKLITSTR